MNIFVLDKDPVKAAKYHCDKHCKMLCESMQMLSTCIRHLGIDDDKLYKKFNPNHTCNVWLRESRENVQWLFQMARALGEENVKRYGKKHKSTDLINYSERYFYLFPDKPMTNFKLAMFEQFRTNDPVHSYRLFYSGAKFRFAKWKTQIPDWWEEYRKIVKENNLEVANDKNDGITL